MYFTFTYNWYMGSVGRTRQGKTAHMSYIRSQTRHCGLRNNYHTYISFAYQTKPAQYIFVLSQTNQCVRGQFPLVQKLTVIIVYTEFQFMIVLPPSCTKAAEMWHQILACRGRKLIQVLKISRDARYTTRAQDRWIQVMLIIMRCSKCFWTYGHVCS